MPMILDTGAEISALPLSFFDTLFPGQAPPESVIRAFGFGGSTVRMRGPVTLRVEVCAVTLSHAFFMKIIPLFSWDTISFQPQRWS